MKISPELHRIVASALPSFDRVDIADDHVGGWIYERIDPLGPLQIYWRIDLNGESAITIHRQADSENPLASARTSPWKLDPEHNPIDRNEILSRTFLVRLAKSVIIQGLAEKLEVHITLDG